MPKSEACSNCGQAKSKTMTICDKSYTFKVMCKCEAAEHKRSEEEWHNKQRQSRLDRLKVSSMMDDSVKQCTFENFMIDENNRKHHKLALSYCNNWKEMKDKNIGFLLYGDPGTGKSYLSYCVANRLLDEYVPVIAVSTISLLNRIKKTYSLSGAEGMSEILSCLKNADLVILDDLGAENDTEWATVTLYEIIDSRYRDKKPMIITTNLSLEELKNKLTGRDGVTRTFDRLNEMCSAVEVRGKSKRLDIAKQKGQILKKLMEDLNE